MNTQVVLEKSNATVSLAGDPLFSNGAAGLIYAHPTNRDLCIKLYRDGTIAAAHEAKVRAMLANPPGDIFADVGGARIAQLAWPLEAVRKQGKFAGFVMPYIDKSRAIKMDRLIRPIWRTRDRLPEHQFYRLLVCLNVAKLLRSVHLKGHRMIDVKPANIFVYAWNPNNPQKGAGCVALLDCDGFSIAGASGKSLRGDFASDDYILPTALKSSGAFDGDYLNNHAVEQDTWAFAVVAFQLLNEGLLPITAEPIPGSGVVLPGTNMESWRTLGKDTYAYAQRGGAKVRPPAESLHHWMSNQLRSLFDKTFLNPTNPPSLKDWIAELQRLTDKRQACKRNPTHWRLGDKCGQCEIAGGGLRQTAMPRMAAASPPPPTKPPPTAHPPPPPVNPPQPSPPPTINERDRRVATGKAIRRGIWTGLITGAAIPLARRFGFEGAEPLIYAGFALMSFWLSADAFNNASMRAVSRSATSTEKRDAWIRGFGGHAIVALIFASLAGAGYNIVRNIWHNIRQEAEDRERLRFDVLPYTGPLREAKESGSYLRTLPIRDDGLAPPIRETIAGEDFNVTGQVNQADRVWYQVQLSDGQTAYIAATLTVPRPIRAPRPPPPPPPVFDAPQPEQGPQSLRPPPQLQNPPPSPVVQEADRYYVVLPEYPERAANRGREGLVKIGFTVFENGSTGNFDVVDESPRGFGFADAAIEAIRQWRYRPRTVDGRPERQRIVAEIPFRLEGERR